MVRTASLVHYCVCRSRNATTSYGGMRGRRALPWKEKRMALNEILMLIVGVTVSCMAISASISFVFIARAEVLRAKSEVQSKKETEEANLKGKKQ